MRVIAGIAKGRVLKAVPGQQTRPTSDKVKEAIYSMIGPYFSGGVVLDLFAGTGGLGIEACSRGAERAIFVDSESKSVAVIKHNLQVTGMEAIAEVYRNDALRAVKVLARRNLKLQLVFLDPPYRMTNMMEYIDLFLQHNMLEADAYIVVEHDAKVTYPDSYDSIHVKKVANYGDTTVTIYQYCSE
ncbi:16S rRNA (guanine(966)-N(2))-methyltransferase RsmD [Paenibacillus yanchengensis]|uniref:16S rRNA (Guanine(966)-N(2))-methyltransferase RsmD n=1 Tax=Paenibacillus yanchengensis TaxID=2035833 RepID=A0ABW4YMB0_9BACL